MRLFIAIELPPEARALLGKVQRELAARLRGAGLERTLHWVAPDNIHLTLRFLGDTTVQQQAHMVRALEVAAQAQTPFTLEIAGLGAFPSFRRPSVLWAGVRGARTALDALRDLQVPLELAARAAGFVAEDRPWSPHLTLARFRREAPAGELAQAGALLRPPAPSEPAAAGALPAPDFQALFPVGELVLMRSDLRPQGALYTPLARFPLRLA